MTQQDFLEIIRDKKVLFITPSDVDYIRNKQEINILKRAAKRLDIIAPADTRGVKPTGIGRILLVNLKTFLAGIGKYEVVFIAGLPQLIVPFCWFFFRKKVLIIDFFISIYDTLVCDRKILSERIPCRGFLNGWTGLRYQELTA